MLKLKISSKSSAFKTFYREIAAYFTDLNKESARELAISEWGKLDIRKRQLYAKIEIIRSPKLKKKSKSIITRPSGYNIFMKTNYSKIRDPKLTMAENSKLVGLAWCSLSNVEKSKYLSLKSPVNKRNRLSKGNPPLDNNEKNLNDIPSVTNPNKSKRKISLYSLFVKNEFPNFHNVSEKSSVTFTKMAAKWKTMTQKEKAKYRT
eukprot:NODE_244_length_13037_cov_0.560442.p7 type:complete len:205 gc:universal NODE_244_length_13037_cov_0.560442:9561-8947(-)